MKVTLQLHDIDESADIDPNRAEAHVVMNIEPIHLAMSDMEFCEKYLLPSWAAVKHHFAHQKVPMLGIVRH